MSLIEPSTTASDAERPGAPSACTRKTSGRIHSVESFGAVDGPGIRLVIYLQGCPLRCVYCHNADCIKSGAGENVDAAELIQLALRYRSYMRASGGGITVSGGEPLMQPGFTAELLAQAKAQGLHTAVDTSGFADVGRVEEVIELADMFLLDLKSFDLATHLRVTGVRPEIIFRFARALEEKRKRTWIRFVLVPGWTDSRRNLQGLAAFIRELTNVERLEVLPFHRLGEYKWKVLGSAYRLDSVEPPAQARVKEVVDYFRSFGINAM